MPRNAIPRASIVVPAYNVADTLAETLRSLLAQTFGDLEVIVVDDGSSDDTLAVARAFDDPRLRIVSQANRGLSGARNTGITEARGTYVGFCDADDLWRPGKLAAHIAHFEANPRIGLSFSGSLMIDCESRPLGLAQRPRLQDITTAHVFRRNPVGNGSAAVMRRAALDDIAFRPGQETTRHWYFDERLRQSEDIECWLRLMLTTDWEIEGIRGLLTLYRVAPGGLSAAIDAQYASWNRVVQRLTPLNPPFFARHTPAARAYQLRYLARRAVSAGDGETAMRLMREGMAASRLPLLQEPVKTLTTLAAAQVSRAFGPQAVETLRRRLLRRAAHS